MILQNINPVILSVGPFTISWYALSYVVSILLGWFYANKIVEKFAVGIVKKHLEDFVSWAIIGIIVGGRLGYVLFYDPIKYLSDPVSIFKTYQGGMSFHGGITGLMIAGYFFCREYKINFLTLTDIISSAAPIGLFLGRIANFINGELYGRVTRVSWAMIFPNSDLQMRHPSQLYEAFFEGFVLFIVLAYAIFQYKTIIISSLNLAIFLIFYSIFRIIIEIFREPDVQIGFVSNSITMGQILSLPMLLIGIYLIIKLRCQSASR